MKTKRRGFLLGVDSSFFPRSRKAAERLRRQSGKPGESRPIWEHIIDPSAASTEHPERMRPGFQPPAYVQPEPSQDLDLEKIWAFVDQTRRSPGYAGTPFAVRYLTRPTQYPEHALGEIVQFFGIPTSYYQGRSIEQVWSEILVPMFDEYAASMNRTKPFHLPGFLVFSMSPENELAVVYYER